MNYKEKKKIKNRFLCVIMCFILFGAALYYSLAVLMPKIEKTKSDISSRNSVIQRLDSVKGELEQTKMLVEANNKKFENLDNNKNSYIAYIGNLTANNELNIDKIKVADMRSVVEGSISGMRVFLEIDGKTSGVVRFINELYNGSKMCRINSLSFRLVGDNYKNADRNFSNLQGLLSWWQDIPITQNNTSQNTETSSTEENKTIEVNTIKATDFMEREYTNCYIEVEFLGTLN